jgi:aryl-phospho-beta-D-glucosidase BglC (GH1 family)
MLSDQFLDYFFTLSDGKFFATQGLNCIRIHFNFRHFEDDLNAGIYKPEGFRILDRIIQCCAAGNLYMVLDLHAVPRGQNQDWHSDSGVHKALIWEYKDFQDRIINLWKAIAEKYKSIVHVTLSLQFH